MFDLQGLGLDCGTAAMLAMLLAACIFAIGWFGRSLIPPITCRICTCVSSFVVVSAPMLVMMASSAPAACGEIVRPMVPFILRQIVAIAFLIIFPDIAIH